MATVNKTQVDLSQPYPTLSTEGWILNLGAKVDMIFAHWITSQYHQTTYSVGHVKSCQYLVKTYGSRPPELSSAIASDLKYLLEPYFEYVDVIVTHKHRQDDYGNNLPQVDYTISMDIRHGGYKWEQFKYIRTKDSTFEQLATLNETGSSAFN